MSQKEILETRSVDHEIEIDAPPETVWGALTDAAELERWFALEARVEPGEGGSIWMSWKNEYRGESEILVWEPNRHLRTTWGMEGEEGPPQITDYRIEGRGGRTVLRVVTSGFPADPTWDAWVEGTRYGWRFELRSLAEYLERHAGRPREVVYLRRRVALPNGEAWSRLTGPDGFGPRPMDGDPFLHDPPRVWAAVVPDFGGALVRVSLEPVFGREDVHDVTLWLAAWGIDAARLGPVREEWSGMLERLYPEGETV